MATPGQAHVGSDDDAGGVGIDHPGHGHAHRRQVAGRDLALLQRVFHDLFDHGEHLLWPAGPRRRLPLALEDSPRFADQRGLHLRAADVHAQVKAILVESLRGSSCRYCIARLT